MDSMQEAFENNINNFGELVSQKRREARNKIDKV